MKVSTKSRLMLAISLMLITFSTCDRSSFDSANYEVLYSMNLCSFFTSPVLKDISGMPVVKAYPIPADTQLAGITSKCFLSFSDPTTMANHSILVQGVLKPSTDHVDVLIRGFEDLVKAGKAEFYKAYDGVPAYFDKQVNILYLMTHPDRYVSVAASTKFDDAATTEKQNSWIKAIGRRLLTRSNPPSEQ